MVLVGTSAGGASSVPEMCASFRVWDAWAERAVFDVHAETRRRGAVCGGFSDGNCRTLRHPSAGPRAARCYTCRDSNAPVVGMAMLGGDEQRERLLVGTRDGENSLVGAADVQEALVEFNVNRVQHREWWRWQCQQKVVAILVGFGSSTAAFVDGQHRMMQQDGGPSARRVDCLRHGRRHRVPRWRPGVPRCLSAAASSFYSPTGAMSGISSLPVGPTEAEQQRRGQSVTSGSRHHFTSPQRRQQQQTGAAGPPPPAAMRFHKQRVLLGLATAEGQFRSYAMPSSVDSGVSSNSTSGGAEDVLGTGAGGMASAVLRRI
ncbi:hypothetical protein niasHT_027837 [Heterodera trifolii]|uniref:Uncharacterized protein n=1 Tax=Heterodera trifolii TaxID=157864 RepID=A0ABD2JSB3_9BILA